MDVISKENPSIVRTVSYQEYNQTRDEYAHSRAAGPWEDLERFAYQHNAQISPAIERPAPTKNLYIGFHECDEGVDNFDFQVWAHSKANVIEWLRRPCNQQDWWDRLKSQVRNPRLDIMHPFDVLDIIEKTNIDGDSEFAFRIMELSPDDITDLNQPSDSR